ncbi:MAG: hypothetical protein AAGB93_17580, partial [Planctomycetota bacterium]
MKLQSATLVALLIAGGGLPPADARAALAQTDRSRELKALSSEQQSLERQIKRLREKIVQLAPRYEAESRPAAAELLRRALEYLDERPEDTEGRTIDELMATSTEALDTGRVLAALERQERIITRVAALLDILTERDRQESIEADLEEIREIRAALDSLADEERSIREETEQLRKESTTAEQREVQERVERALQEQRELLARNEDQARSSGLLDAERLLGELQELQAEQRARAEEFRAQNAGDRAALEAMRPALAGARANESRAADLDAAAEALEDAARAASESAGSDDEAAEAARA